MPSRLLPTNPDQGDGEVIDFLREFRSECRSNTDASELVIVTYAASLAGWRLVRNAIALFRTGSPSRRVRAFIGLDHFLTQPTALREMRQSGLRVYTVSTWPRVFHPKLFAFRGGRQLAVLAGSNNLTRGGLRSNFEFAIRVRLRAENGIRFNDWLKVVEGAALRLTAERLADYEEQFDRVRAVRRVVPTTRQRVHDLGRPDVPAQRRFRRAIVEVTIRETGTQGTQIQMPMEVVRNFFGMEANTSQSLHVDNDDAPHPRDLTLTAFGNNTARLSLWEVDLAARPCVLELWWEGTALLFRVVREADSPGEYQRLLGMCISQTRADSKHFCLLR